MTPEQHVALYSPTYSIPELVGIGLFLALMFAGPTIAWIRDARDRKEAARREAEWGGD